MTDEEIQEFAANRAQSMVSGLGLHESDEAEVFNMLRDEIVRWKVTSQAYGDQAEQERASAEIAKAFHDLVIKERDIAEERLRWSKMSNDIKASQIEQRDEKIVELETQLVASLELHLDPRKATYQGVPVIDKIEGLEAQLEDRDLTIAKLKARLGASPETVNSRMIASRIAQALAESVPNSDTVKAVVGREIQAVCDLAAQADYLRDRIDELDPAVR